jgi:hypothetical protein
MHVERVARQTLNTESRKNIESDAQDFKPANMDPVLRESCEI